MKNILLAGNPNSGKTTLFNRLTGLNHRVGNYPGVTVERKVATIQVNGAQTQLVDLPGTYSLIARSRDEAIAFQALTGDKVESTPDCVVIVVDASNLLRSLYLAQSILDLGHPTIIALNMVDLANAQGISTNTSKLSELLNVPVVEIVARSGQGISELKNVITQSLNNPQYPIRRHWRLEDPDENAIQTVSKSLDTEDENKALWILSSIAAAKLEQKTDLTHLSIPDSVLKVAEEELSKIPDNFTQRLIEARYRFSREITDQCIQKTERSESFSDRLDSWLLHPVWGSLIFLSVMAFVFNSIFSWADPLIEFFENIIGTTQGFIKSSIGPGAISDLLADAIVGGVGNVVVFVPQIAFLFFFLAILEDSGYLARAAFMADQVMARIGLHGKAFIPLLSGFACAIPAIMATRTIESPKDRLVTILVTPLTSCSARLPVYTLLIAALFSQYTLFGGWVNLGGVLMLSMYVLSILFTIVVAAILKRTILVSPTPPLVLELPTYRIPQLGNVLRRVLDRCFIFIQDAGSVILACSIILWALLYFPSNIPERVNFDVRSNEIAQIEAEQERAEKLTILNREAQAAQLEDSFAGQMGQTLEPVFAPLGYDWKIVIGLVASFAAREVFVSTLGLVYGADDSEDAQYAPLRARLKLAQNNNTGKPTFTPLVGLSLMLFFLLALQCMSTIAAIKRETNSWQWPLFAFCYTGLLAWSISFIVYQTGLVLGFS